MGGGGGTIPFLTAIEVHGGIAPIAGAWDDLADRVGASPFTRPGWMAPWWTAFGRGSLEILTTWRGPTLTGVLPLHRNKGVLRSVSNVHTPEFVFLAESPDELHALANEFVERTANRSSLILVESKDPGLDAVRASTASHRKRTVERVLQRSPYIVLEGDWRGFRPPAGRKLLADLRRRRRRLAEHGEVTVTVEDGSGDVEAALIELFKIESKGWKGEQGTAIASSPDTRRFYSEVAHWAAERGWLRLASLRVEHVAIACGLYFQHGSSIYRIKGGYDPGWSAYAPSKVLICSMVERAFADGVARFDFLGADEPYKREWTDATRELCLLQVFGRSPSGRLARAVLARKH